MVIRARTKFGGQPKANCLVRGGRAAEKVPLGFASSKRGKSESLWTWRTNPSKYIGSEIDDSSLLIKYLHSSGNMTALTPTPFNKSSLSTFNAVI
jgi:hypothetical protein